MKKRPIALGIRPDRDIDVVGVSPGGWVILALLVLAGCGSSGTTPLDGAAPPTGDAETDAATSAPADGAVDTMTSPGDDGGSDVTAVEPDGGAACVSPVPMRTLYDNDQGLGVGATVPVGDDCAAAYFRTAQGDLRVPFATGMPQVIVPLAFRGFSFVENGVRYYCSGSTFARQPAGAPLPASALPGQECAYQGRLFQPAGDIVVRMVVDDQGLTIDHIPFGGGPPTTVYRRARPANPVVVAAVADPNTVAWAELDPQTRALTGLFRLRAGQTEPEKIPITNTFTTWWSGLAIDGDRLLLAETDLLPANPALQMSRIVAFDKDGHATPLVDGDFPAEMLTVADGSLYWTYRRDCQTINAGHNGQSCAGGVARVALAGGTVQRLVTTQHIPWGLTVGPGALVYGDRDNDWQHFDVGPVRLFVAPLP